MARTKNQAQNKKVNKILIAFCGGFFLICLLVGLYLASYYRAGSVALNSIVSNDSVVVEEYKDMIWFENTDEESRDLLTFYHGARVDFKSYAPLMQRLAKNGLDCVVLQSPLNFAILEQNAFEKAADRLDEGYRPYERLFIGGHSMGGVVAANYASEHPEKVEGLIMLAAYPSKELPEDLKVLEVYGSEDKVLSRKKMEESAKFLPSGAIVYEIPGGNHAQFGDYGRQSWDGEATISSEEQWDITARQILKLIKE